MLLARAAGHLSVTCTAPPGWPPAHLPACAEATERIAELTGGIRLDAERSVLLPAPWRPSSPTAPEVFSTLEWVCVEISPDDDGRYDLHTAGMARFGLPDLGTWGLQAHHVHGWFHLLHGLAGVLVRRLFRDARLGPHGGMHTVPEEIVVSTADVTAAFTPAASLSRRAGRRAASTGRARVRLRHDVRAGLLTVLPPEGLTGGEARWRERTALVMCEDADVG
jgi:hypothetical protein